MKIRLLLLTLLLPFQLIAQDDNGTVAECAPMKKGKVCYTDVVEVKGHKRDEIFETINKWAIKVYGRDVFLSNVSSNKTRGSILISSKVELLLNDTDKTRVKYKMYITCLDNGYSIEARDITYQYDPDDSNRNKVYPAESVIAKNGKGNTVPLIQDPVLFCNATHFFIQNLFSEIYNAANQ